MVYTYVIRSRKDNKWYTGTTNDLRKRFQEHNESKVTSTKGRGPFDLIYYEACIDMNDAFAREKYLKTGMGKRYLKNRMKRFLSVTGQAMLDYVILTAIVIAVLLIMGYYVRNSLSGKLRESADVFGGGEVYEPSVTTRK